MEGAKIRGARGFLLAGLTWTEHCSRQHGSTAPQEQLHLRFPSLGWAKRLNKTHLSSCWGHAALRNAAATRTPAPLIIIPCSTALLAACALLVRRGRGRTHHDVDRLPQGQQLQSSADLCAACTSPLRAAVLCAGSLSGVCAGGSWVGT